MTATVTRPTIGWSGTVHLRPGQAATDVYNLRAKIASVFDVHASSVVLSPMESERRLRIEVYETNPLQQIQYFTQPSLDMETGRFVTGHGTLGQPAYWDLWQPGVGACHGLIFGTTRAGKSGFSNLLLAEARMSGCVLPVFLDPEGGLSGPAWVDTVPIFASSMDEIREALRAVTRLADYRRAEMAKELYLDRRGVERKGRTWTEPTDRWRLVVVNCDEAPRVMRDGECAALIKDGLTRTLKIGIGYNLYAQVPSISELGGDGVIRSQAASLNIIAFRTSDRMSGTMGIPGAMPIDPATLPKKWPDGSKTNGLALSIDGELIRTLWVEDPWEWSERGEAADFNEGEARALAGDWLNAWLHRHGRGGEATHAPVIPDAAAADNVTAIDEAASGSLRERLVAVLTERGESTTGVLHQAVSVDGRPDLTQVSRALRKAAERGEIRDLGHRRWGAITNDHTTDEAVGEE